MQEPFDSESRTKSSDKPPRVETAPDTFAALRHRNFQLYFGGQLISNAGTWMQVIAQGWLVYQLTHSDLALGIVGFAAAVPALIVSPWGGVVVDLVPKRTLLIITQASAMLLAFILAALSFTHVVQEWHIILLAGGIGLVNAFDGPGRQAFVVEMVGRDDLSNAIALNSLMGNGARDRPGIGWNIAGSCRRGLVLHDQRHFFSGGDHWVMGDAGQTSSTNVYDGIPVEAIDQRHSIRFKTNGLGRPFAFGLDLQRIRDFICDRSSCFCGAGFTSRRRGLWLDQHSNWCWCGVWRVHDYQPAWSKLARCMAGHRGHCISNCPRRFCVYAHLCCQFDSRIRFGRRLYGAIHDDQYASPNAR